MEDFSGLQSGPRDPMKTSRTQVRDEMQEVDMKTFVRRVLWIAVALVVAAAPLLQGAEPSFVGARKCKACHLKEFNSWSESRMAKSFDLLKPCLLYTSPSPRD